MKFVLNRNHTLASTLGHTIEFEKGVPVHVPPALHKEVIGIGAQPEEELPEDENKKPAAPEGDERKELIKLAMEEMVANNVREEFTAAGSPHNKVLSAKLGFTVSAQERDAVWAELKAAS